MEANRDPLTEKIIGAAIEVHRWLGPGLLESNYEDCLCHELSIREMGFRRQVPVPIRYKGISLKSKYRLDVVVEELVVLEIKSVDHLLGIHEAQLLTYLRHTGVRKGLLINFNVRLLVDGVRRFLL